MKIAILTTDNRQYYRDFGNPVPHFGTAPEALLQGFAQLPEIEVHVLSCLRQPVTSPEKIAPNIFYHALIVPKIGWMRTAYQGCIRAERKKLKQIRPDIVHGQGTELEAGISAVFSGFPNVITIHGNMRLIAKVNHARPFSFPWLAARLETFTLPRTDGVVCITHYTQNAVANLAKRTWVLPNAVDSSFFDVKAQPSLERPPRILCVGLVCPRKNQNAFIRALDLLTKEHRFEVLFLGQTLPGRAYDEEFLQLVRERPWCSYGGMANRTKLKEHFREASLLALPSIEDNCPMVVLEAMAAGVPVIAANVGGVPDLVEDGKTGFLCDPFNLENIRTTVERALKDMRFTRSMAERAHEEARKRFYPVVIARKHVEIYRETLDKVRR